MAVVPLNYYDLIETFPRPGCAICNLLQRDVERYLDSLLYEYANVPSTHVSIRASRGLCAQHSSQLLDYGAAVLPQAILASQVLDEVLRLAAASVRGSALARLLGSGEPSLSARLEPVAPCPVCRSMLIAENQHVIALVSHLDDARLQDAYRASAGLCLPHVRAALRAAEPPVQERLVTIQRAIWERLKAELDEFARKYDANFASEKMGAEGDSWRRAAGLIAGAPAIFGLRRG